MKITYLNSSIGSVQMLAKTLDVSLDFLERVALDPASYYSVSTLAKKSGGQRIISDPVKELKIVQRRIVRRIFSKCSFPHYLFGSIKDSDNPRDFVRNAQLHINAKEVVAFDIENFFPSVRPGCVKKIYKYLMNFPEAVSLLLVKLTTLNDGLPQGAPTSSYLANLVFYDTEHKLAKVFHDKGLVYSRLVDDITISSKKGISSKERSFIYQSVYKFLADKKLKICKRKYQVTNTNVHGKKTVITGLIVEDGKVKLPKEKVKEIGHRVHKLKSEAAVTTTEHDYHAEHATVSGLVALYKRLELKKSEDYRSILRVILPTYSKEKIKKISWLCRRFIKYAKSHPCQREDEGYAKKYHRFRHKLNVIKRTSRKQARSLEAKLLPLRPTRLLSSYYE
jgi:hypothetical protein